MYNFSWTYSSFLFFLSTLFAEESVFIPYFSPQEKSAKEAETYSKTTESSARYLSYRDIPDLIAKYVHGTTALDYGAGTGISTQFLRDQGMEVTGVDVSEEMLQQAKGSFPHINFHHIKRNKIHFPDNTYDLVFSSFVLFEIGTKDEITAYLKEAYRIMKPDAALIALTGSEEMYSSDGFIYSADYPENHELKSGDRAKACLRDIGIEFTDYYWTEEDYRELFEQAGFILQEVHRPLGREGEGYPWKAELQRSPFVIFVAKKAS